MLADFMTACLARLQKRQVERGVELSQHVRPPAIQGDVVSAAVRDGKRTFYVLLQPTNDGANCRCSCAKSPCEHVFAVGMAAMQAHAKSKAANGDAATDATPAPDHASDEWRRRIKLLKPQPESPIRTVKHQPHYAIDLQATKRLRRLRCHVLAPRGRGYGPLSTTTDLRALPDVDRAALAALRATPDLAGRSRPTGWATTIDPTNAPLVIPALFATGRVFTAPHIGPWVQALTPLQLDQSGPFTFCCGIRRNTQVLELHGWLQRGDERIDHACVRSVVDEGYALTDGRMVALASPRTVRAARDLLAEPMQAPLHDEPQFLAAVLDLTVDYPELTPPIPTRSAGEPQPVLLVQMSKLVSGQLPVELVFEYGDRMTEWDDPVLLLPPLLDGTYLQRNRAREVHWREVCLQGEGVSPTPMRGCLLVHPRALRELLERLLDQGFRILADGKPLRSATTISIAVSSGIDWFDVRGAVVFAGGQRLPLPKALALWKKGDRLVELGDGSTAVLPEDWLRRWAAVLELGEASAETFRLQRSQALLLDVLLAERAEIEAVTDAGFVALRQRLDAFRSIAPLPEPAGFHGQLRPYQQLGLGWLVFLRELGLGGCLADDMGLGKTVQVLALLQRVYGEPATRPAEPSLLVVPRSLLDNWRREAARFAPSLRTLDFTGTDRWQRLAEAGGCGALDLLVTTYGTLRSDIERLHESAQQFEYAILDEAQAIENELSLTHKAVRLLRSHHRLALTGTPVQNHIGELWALFEFLLPRMLGKSRAFKALLSQGDGRGHGLDFAALHRTIAPFLLRRTKEEVLPELPEKQEQDLLCDLDGSQAATYEQLREHYRDRLLRGDEPLDNKERFMVLEALLRLRQVACHEGLVDAARAADSSAKLDALLPMLQEIAASGHKALVFSQFTEWLAIVRKRLDALSLPYEYLDGKTRNRQQKVDRFQQDAACPFFLVSLKAGGTGLNLTAADYVFLLDPWWNPAAEAQAIDRAHRLGQTRKVTAYRLIARDTVEEKVLALQAEKKALVDAVLGGDKSLLAKLTRDDLAQLLS